MIKINNLSKSSPYLKFEKLYLNAITNNQKHVEAACISSYDEEKKEVNSRFVNIKFINNLEFIFFSNYLSPKSNEFSVNNKISAIFYWHKINTQIRMKAIIEKTSRDFNIDYFKTRSHAKNALAISSKQSQKISSYLEVKKQFNYVLENENLEICPEYWGGFKFKPFYFEFWEGHENRINKREAFTLINSNWESQLIQP